MPGDATPIVVAAKPTRDYLAALFVKNGATAAKRGAAAPRNTVTVVLPPGGMVT